MQMKPAAAVIVAIIKAWWQVLMKSNTNLVFFMQLWSSSWTHRAARRLLGDIAAEISVIKYGHRGITHAIKS